MKRSFSDGIALKKYHGQNFLRDHSVVLSMLTAVDIKNKSVFEIGCGDGFLTREILAQNPARLWVFEIDKEWADKVTQDFSAFTGFTMFHTNVLDVDFSTFEPEAPWILLSNLPYHVTFPILKKVHANRDKISEGVVMVQEEVAQKIVKTRGRGYGYISLFFQYYFEWKLLVKVPPTAFFPAPKVHSRLLHFKPKKDLISIPDEVGFWKFIKLCFSQPRRTLKNNLEQTHFDLTKVPEKFSKLRAQQMSMADLLELWTEFCK